MTGCEPIVCTRPTTAGYEFSGTEANLDLTTGAFDTTGLTISCASGYSGTPQVSACTQSGDYTVTGCDPLMCFLNANRNLDYICPIGTAPKQQMLTSGGYSRWRNQSGISGQSTNNCCETRSCPSGNNCDMRDFKWVVAEYTANQSQRPRDCDEVCRNDGRTCNSYGQREIGQSNYNFGYILGTTRRTPCDIFRPPVTTGPQADRDRNKNIAFTYTNSSGSDICVKKPISESSVSRSQTCSQQLDWSGYGTDLKYICSCDW